MNYKKILVTGSAGFIGSHLYDDLSDSGYDVYGLDDLSGGFLRNISRKDKFKKLDLRDRKKTAAFIRVLKPELIFHLAADATEGRSQFTPFSALDRNLTAHMNLLVPAIDSGLEKIILVSSMSVYGAQQVPFDEKMIPQPEDIYGISKMAMENMTRVMSDVYGFKYVIIRPHNVYGPRQNLSDPYRNVIGIFINRLLHDKNFYIYGDGEQMRAFSYIDDIIPPIIKAAFNKKCESQAINIGSDDPVSINDLSNLILKTFLKGDIPSKLNPTQLQSRPKEVKYAYCSHKLAQKLLNFRHETKLEDGISKMIKWAKSIGPQPFTYLDKLEIDHPSVPKTWKLKLI